MSHSSTSRTGLGNPCKVTCLGECTPSSEALQAAIAVLSALVYSFCKDILILELLQASSLQRIQYLSLGVVQVPPEIHLETPLVQHDLQSLRLNP